MPNETVIIDTPKGKREIPRFVPIKTEAGHHHGKKLEKEYADQNREIEEYLKRDEGTKCFTVGIDLKELENGRKNTDSDNDAA